jgi:hypothetical protein
MGLLKKACRSVWKRLSWGKRAYKPAVAESSNIASIHATTSVDATTVTGELLEVCSRALEGAAVGESSSLPELGPAVDAGQALSRSSGYEMLPTTAAAGEPLCARNLSSESDSGVCLGEGELTEADSECACCFSGEEDDEGEDFERSEDECECEECAFARCEDILEDWHVSAKDLALDKVLSTRRQELVYSGYWHGSVTVHQRQSPLLTELNVYIQEATTLSKIRHENVQLFLGVCLDLNPVSVALVMSNIKGESLDSLLHRTGQELQFSAMSKYLNQIAQGMAYLHDRGINHPLLTSKSIHIHYRACISMLSPAACSNTLEPSQLVYLSPEVIRTLQPTSSPSPSSSSSSSNHRTLSLTTYPAHLDSREANIFSFGTIVYEMVTVSRPFRATPGELIVWEVGNGRCQSLHHMNAGKLRDIIKHCWASGPEYRPTFKELLSTLEHNMSPRACGLNAYFSFSDPGRLASTGLH